VKLLVVVTTVLACALAAGVDTAAATNECRGLNPCVPVAGPWVVVPVGRSVPRPQVQYQLNCPTGYVVGGVDAELTDRRIDLAFLGKSGSPVNPGITTSRTIVFVATYVGSGAATPAFRPHAGCIRPRGCGRRTPTAVAAVVPPGEPTTRRVRTFRIAANQTRTLVQACRPAERLVGAYHARAFFTRTPPSASLVGSLSATRAVRANRVVVTGRGGPELRGVRAVVQVAAVCAEGT
jgi:hypothetical protein